MPTKNSHRALQCLPLLLTALCTPGCGSGGGSGGGSAAGADAAPSCDLPENPFAPTRALSSVTNWVYQLQNPDSCTLAHTNFDLVVTDYSSDGSDAGRFSSGEVGRIRGSGKGKVVLAYMSIGEAEDYRFYWNSNWDNNHDGTPDAGAPAWLGPANPQFPNNYKVRYWDPAWQSIIFSYLDKIEAAGFDGVYLDIIDAYEYWGPGGESGLNRPTAAADMVSFVKALTQHARTTGGNPNFLIVPQNGEQLSAYPDYVQAVSAIGKEDTWYLGNTPQPPSTIIQSLANLDVFKAAGKPVFVIDYVTGQPQLTDFYSKAKSKGYFPYASTIALDHVSNLPG